MITTPQDLPEGKESFIPKSVVETSIKDPKERYAVIRKRRTEHDIDALNLEVCLYLTPEEAAKVPKAVQARYFSELQPISGKLLRFSSSQIDSEIPNFVGEIPQELRERFTLEVRLPDDLWGYAFYVAPIPPQTENNPAQFARGDRMALNGDGMIYRLGFDQSKATLKTRITKTPCYYADLATQVIPRYDRIGFRFLDGGMVRHSICLGTRNQMNTAFLATRNHLLVTFDGARPYVIDPDTLELLEPIGAVSEWKGLGPKLPPQLTQVFQPYSNPAHPVCDHSQIQPSPDCSGSDEIFTVNYSQGLSLVRDINRFRRWLIRSLGRRGQVLTNPWGSFTRLIRYQLGGQVESWQLFLPSGEPVVIEQAVHQMVLTEDYIILGDIAFEIELSQIFSPFLFGYLRNIVTKQIGYQLSLIFLEIVQPLPFANLYVVRRKDLDCATDGKLSATKVSLPREVSHFAADYQNPKGKIILHVAKASGWDVTEWIGEYDESVNPERENMPFITQIIKKLSREELIDKKGRKCLQTDLRGMLPGPVDLNQMSRYEIDGSCCQTDRNASSGAILNSHLISDPGFNDTGRNTWSLSVNTHRNLKRDHKSESSEIIKNIYWMSWGFSWEIIPKRIYRAYKNRDVRTIPYEHLPDIDKPMTLLRLDTERVEIADSFEFPFGYFARSPQFISSSAPCPEGMDESAHGYVVCVVLADDEHGKPKDEFWVFHADDFKGKPIYRLSHPQVSLGLTIHSTWLSDVQVDKYSKSKRQEIRQQSLKRDYEDLINHKGGLAKQLFEEIISPCFIEQTSEQELLSHWKRQYINYKA